MSEQPAWTTARKLAWIEQLGGDAGLTILSLRAALRLATKYVNAEKGYAWPAKKTLAGDLEASIEGVRKAIVQLVQRGHLTVEAGGDGRGGRTLTSKYRPVVKDTGDPENSQRAEGVSHAKLPTAGGGLEDENSQRLEEKLPTAVGTNPLEEPFEEREGESPLDPLSLPAAIVDAEWVEIEGAGSTNVPAVIVASPSKSPKHQKREPTPDEIEAFEAFWAAYPLKKGRKPALDTFVGVLRSGKATADRLNDGARAYAAERAGQDPTKTKYAQGWLTDERWTDETAQAAGPQMHWALAQAQKGMIRQ